MYVHRKILDENPGMRGYLLHRSRQPAKALVDGELSNVKKIGLISPKEESTMTLRTLEIQLCSENISSCFVKVMGVSEEIEKGRVFFL